MHRKTTVTSIIDGRVNVPMIRLRGGWLTRAGFREGDTVRIEVEEGRLVLVLSRETPPQGIAAQEGLAKAS